MITFMGIGQTVSDAGLSRPVYCKSLGVISRYATTTLSALRPVTKTPCIIWIVNVRAVSDFIDSMSWTFCT